MPIQSQKVAGVDEGAKAGGHVLSSTTRGGG